MKTSESFVKLRRFRDVAPSGQIDVRSAVAAVYDRRREACDAQPPGGHRPPLQIQSFKTLSRAFTLVELLVVITIIVILTALAIPAITSIQGGSQLRRGGQMVSDTMSLARQTAVSHNRSVIVRFYAPSAGEPYVACQQFVVEDDGTMKPGRLTRFPEEFVVSSNAAHTRLPANIDTVDVPALGNMSYTELRFRRDGSTNLASAEDWYATIINKRDAGTDKPVNFLAILVDPVNGSVRTFQP